MFTPLVMKRWHLVIWRAKNAWETKFLMRTNLRKPSRQTLLREQRRGMQSMEDRVANLKEEKTRNVPFSETHGPWTVWTMWYRRKPLAVKLQEGAEQENLPLLSPPMTPQRHVLRRVINVWSPGMLTQTMASGHQTIQGCRENPQRPLLQHSLQLVGREKIGPPTQQLNLSSSGQWLSTTTNAHDNYEYWAA